MNPTAVKTRQLQLLTYNKGPNKFYDSTFSVPLDFKPNARGLYNVTINEVLFKNDEAVFNPGDWFQFNVNWTDDTHAVHDSTVRYTVKSGIYIHSTDDTKNLVKIKEVLVGKKTWCDSKTLTGPDPNIKINILTYIPGEGQLKNIAEEANPRDYMILQVAINDDYVVNSMTISASNAFLYIYRNLFENYDLVEYPTYLPEGIKDIDDTELLAYNARYFEIHNPQFNGPIEYVLDTNINTTTKTINENGQVYNVMARTYNLAPYHNNIQQMNSTMAGTVKDLTSLRVRLVNDFFEPVHIFNPVLVTLTVSNTD